MRNFITILLLTTVLGCTEVTTNKWYTECNVTKEWVAYYEEEKCGMEYNYTNEAWEYDCDTKHWDNPMSNKLEVNSINGDVTFKNCKKLVKNSEYIFSPPTPTKYKYISREHFEYEKLKTETNFGVYVFDASDNSFDRIGISEAKYNLLTKIRNEDKEAKVVGKKFACWIMSVKVKAKVDGEVNTKEIDL